MSDILKSSPIYEKAFNTPEEITSSAWSRGSKTDKPYVRVVSQSQMRNIVSQSDRYTMGDVDSGMFGSGSLHASRYLLSKFSGGYMVIDSANQKSYGIRK